MRHNIICTNELWGRNEKKKKNKQQIKRKEKQSNKQTNEQTIVVCSQIILGNDS